MPCCRRNCAGAALASSACRASGGPLASCSSSSWMSARLLALTGLDPELFSRGLMLAPAAPQPAFGEGIFEEEPQQSGQPGA